MSEAVSGINDPIPVPEAEDEFVPHVHEETPPKTEASVWRLGVGGTLISSVFESHSADLADKERDIIYFYAELV